jgi:hypothetical protein
MLDGPAVGTESRAFAPAQMVPCPECVRNNPPTRTNCLYCGAALPISETAADLQNPSLRPLEKWEHGYNNILIPSIANAALDRIDYDVASAAELLKLTPDEVRQIIWSHASLPICRTSSVEDADLVQRRLRALGLDNLIVADADLADETDITRVRAVAIDDNYLSVYERPGNEPIQIPWSELVLFVTGRVFVKRVDLTEKRGRNENQIVDASEFFKDELVVTFYRQNDDATYRLNTNSFDFSCLGPGKKLVVAENIATLVELFRSYAPNAEWDDAYNSLRKVLDIVWPAEQQNQSTGWRRDRPGRRVIGSTAEVSNDAQFVKYSRLRYQLQRMAHEHDEA